MLLSGARASCRAVHACCGMCAALLRVCGASCVGVLHPAQRWRHTAIKQARKHHFHGLGLWCVHVFSATTVVAAATHCQVTPVTPGEAGWCTSRRRTVWVLLHRGRLPAHWVTDSRGLWQNPWVVPVPSQGMHALRGCAQRHSVSASSAHGPAWLVCHELCASQFWTDLSVPLHRSRTV